MVQGVADEVAERVADLFEDGPVELGLLALDDQLDFLLEALGDVSHDPREAVEDRLDGQHAQARDLVLKLAGDAGELLRVFVGLPRQRIVAEPDGQKLGALLQAGLVDHQLAHEVHQLVEAGDVDADRLLGGLEPVAGDGHSLGLRQASGLRAQIGLAALRGRGRSGRVLVVRARGAEGGHGVAGSVDVDAERRLRDLGFAGPQRSGNGLHAGDVVDGGEAFPGLEKLDRPAADEHDQERRPEPGFDLLPARRRRDQAAGLFGFQHQLEEPDRLPFAHRVDAADQDRSRLVATRRLDEKAVDERGDGDVADALLAAVRLFLSVVGRGFRGCRTGVRRGRRGGDGRGGSGGRLGRGSTRRGRGGGGGEKLAELLRQSLRGVGQGLAFLDLGDEGAEDVDRGQQHVREGLDVDESAASERSEEVLHGVGQLRHAAVADGRRRALEGVGGAEDLVDHASVQVVLEIEQALFDPFDLLQGFVREKTVVTLLQIEGQAHVRRPLAGRRGA